VAGIATVAGAIGAGAAAGAAAKDASSAPVLILQGTTDLQTSVEDARLLAAGHAGAKLVLLDGVNHVLKRAPLDRAANIATYADSSLPLASGVIPAIVAFVQGVSRR
jgi:hypothetical protein